MRKKKKKELTEQSSEVVIGGGSFIQGDVTTKGGDYVGRDKISISASGNIQAEHDLIIGDQYNYGSPVTFRNAYLNHLMRNVSNLSLAGIDPKSASDAESQLSLSSVYIDLFTLSVKKDISGHPPTRNEQFESALEQLNQNNRLVLLGDPGSGKSTFINHVALCLAGEALENPTINLSLFTKPISRDQGATSQNWDHGAILPIRIILRDFAARGLPKTTKQATALHLWNFIISELQNSALEKYAPYLRHTLLEKGGLLLLDGLDEVPEASFHREQIKQVVEDFAASFPRCRILVTSRTYAYQQQNWRLGGFTEAILSPFNSMQIRLFIDQWYLHIAELRDMHPEDAQGRAELLKRAIFSSDRLQELAERPLLLTLIASLHAWRGGSLPEKRETLYADTVSLLLDWWESPKTVRNEQGQITMLEPSLAEWLRTDRTNIISLLNELAYKAHATQSELIGTADIDESDLIHGLLQVSKNPDIKPARLVEYLSQRAGLLLPRGVGVYTFPHRTFQEYLAASHLTDVDYPDHLAELARTDPYRWGEITLLAGAKAARGSASTIWYLADVLCFRNIEDPEYSQADAWGAQIAGQALVETANLTRTSERNKTRLMRVKSNLVHIIEKKLLPPNELVETGRTLAILGDPRKEVTSIMELKLSIVPSGWFMMGAKNEYSSNLEDPQHKVLLPEYKIGKYPVTNAQFAEFVAAGGYQESKYWTDAASDGIWKNGQVTSNNAIEARQGTFDYGFPFNLPNHPVVGITWYEALAFTRWLTETWRDSGYIGMNFSVKLPTEAEWEKAARGTDERIFPWGNTFSPERANQAEVGIGSTSAVGCFPRGASPFSIQEMSGNVWEWCSSLLWNYPYNPTDGRENINPSSQEHRVVRGGSFSDNQESVRCSKRFGIPPNYVNMNIGFRVAVVEDKS